MAPHLDGNDEETRPLTEDIGESHNSDISSSSRTLRRSTSSSSDSTMSIALEHVTANGNSNHKFDRYRDEDGKEDTLEDDKVVFEELDIEDGYSKAPKGVDKKYKRWLIALGIVCLAGWLVALALFITNGSYQHRSQLEHDPDAVVSTGNGRKITMDQLQQGAWRGRSHAISWIDTPDGRDGMMLERSAGTNAYLVVEDVLALENHSGAKNRTVLMKTSGFDSPAGFKIPLDTWPSPNLQTVLCLVDKQKNWRHSYLGSYHLFDVATQTAKPLIEDEPEARVQLAHWAPDSSSVAFVRDNNLFLRRLDSPNIVQITESGGEEMFNGVPDWVYEEEVFSGNSATWWSPDAKYIAFLATNETMVPEFPIQYFIQRPSGIEPPPELEDYPDVRQIKYPKAGAPNPVVHIRFYDVAQDQVFDVAIENDFPDDDRLITEVIWAGESGKVLVRQTNRESYILKMVLVDVAVREGRIVREQDVNALDGGWFEITETTTFVPRDPQNGRPTDGYIDTIIHNGYDHLGYFKSLEDEQPTVLTSGKWEVVDAPSALDLKNNLVYFVATKDGSTERHVYRVSLDGSNLEPITDVSKDGYYEVSFSKKAGFALLSYQGPKIPWQSVISTPSNSEKYEHIVEKNEGLSRMASETEMPIKVYSTINVDGVDLNVVERRPHSFDQNKRYPVLFFLYGGPGSQQVDKKFTVDFQSYVAATLGYVVVTVDGRGTGFIGREARCIIRGNLGYYEAMDQIATAKEWGKKKYIDASRIAIWGWSYGGYMTLKTLEQDAGQTFHYGMAVAPVTDWRYYDTIYTERWMHTPQHNPEGYYNASISNVTAISKNIRFLIMHGTSDDNVHTQNTLTLLDQFDLSRIENYDVHFFPDSDHGIYFHGANRIVYDKLAWWLTNAFNGEWARIQNVKPLRAGMQVGVDG